MTLEQIVKDLERRVDLYREESKKRNCPELFYRSRGLYEALAALTASLDGRPEILTLKELGHELRKVLKFRYLTAERPIHNLYFALWNQKPVWNGESWRPADNSDRHIVADFFEFEIVGNLDVSEYRDADGNIDYSKCIVEVADDID